jgi:hypothetical protein
MAAPSVTNPWEAMFLPFSDFLKTWIYRPDTSWFDHLFTLNLAPAPVERHVLDRVGSYGHQLGDVLDALDVLVDALRPQLEQLTKDQRLALAKVQTMAAQAHVAVRDFQARGAVAPR